MSTQPANPAIDVSVLVVNYNTATLLGKMREALDHSVDKLAVEIVVVDNASRDDSVAVLRRDFQDAQVIFNSANVGFGRANNQALAHATGRYVLLLNTDAFVSADTLTKTVAYMDAHAECGVLGVRLIGRDGELQPSCRYFPTPWNVFLVRTGLSRFFPGTRLVDDLAWDQAEVRECDWVPGCYCLLRRSAIDQVGLFDSRYFLYFEEVDLCLAAKRAGWKVVCYPHSSVVHLGGESAKSDSALTASGQQIQVMQIESELLYFRKNSGFAGVLASVLLASLGDAILGSKHLIRGRGFAGAATYLQHAKQVWRLFAKTQWGTAATR
jgi:N-acetylglucosaminyl-diphospho-decaprenol L-rhamnosyltransferase